jgi:uncharacterized delta-60 repeat protein
LHRPCLEVLEDRCLLSSGPLDPTFGTGGIVSTPIAPTCEAKAVAVQPDGKLLVAGNASAATKHDPTPMFTVVRYTTSGSLDTTFGSGGIASTTLRRSSTGIDALALYPLAGSANDGKIVVGGSMNGNFSLARYNSNGSLDTSFGSGGIQSTQIGAAGNSQIESLALQSDGKILAVGVEKDGAGLYYYNHIALARYDSNGTLDTTFGSGGIVINRTGPYDQDARVVAVQGDGKILVGGRYETGTAGLDLHTQFAVFRYNADGTPDSTFGNGTGYTQLPPGGSGPIADGVYSLGLQADGKIVAGGQLTFSGSNGGRFAELARFNSDGSLDPNFGSSGSVTLTNPARVIALGLEANGKIVFTGDNSSTSSIVVGRLKTDGSLDTTFNGTGVFTTPLGYSAQPTSLAIQPADGNVVVTFSGGPGLNLARYLMNGPAIGSFTASANPVPAGTSETLTVSNPTDSNPSATITQVALYLESNNDGTLEPGSDQLLGYAIQSSPGVWTLTSSSAFGLTAGTYFY